MEIFNWATPTFWGPGTYCPIRCDSEGLKTSIVTTKLTKLIPQQP